MTTASALCPGVGTLYKRGGRRGVDVVMLSRRTLIGVSLVAGVGTVLAALAYFCLDPCGQNTYPCMNSTLCVPHAYLCDQRRDCPEGDDESDRQCVNLQGDYTLAIKYAGVLLNGSNSAMKDYMNCTLEEFPPECECRNKTHLFCTDMELTRVPENVSRTVTRMGLQNNSITLDNSSFNEYSLTFIDLSINQLSDLEPGVFNGQVNLTRLFLRYNNLSEIRSGVLDELVGLRWLMLSHNHLVDVDLQSLTAMQRLEWLDMSNNQLTMEGKTFPHLGSLTYLSLHQNSIPVVEEFLLRNLSGLTTLRLNGNKIHSIHRDAFCSLLKLRQLDLANNVINILDSHVFAGQGHLRRLSLENNPLDHVTSELFQPLKDLRSLNLEEIEISDIDASLFESMARLEFLNLKSYHYCTYAPSVPKCQPKSDGVSTLDNLLGWPSIRTSVWSVAAANCVGNVLVLWGRFASVDENRVLSVVVRNLAVADFLMGVYLLLIGTSDVYYRDVFQAHAHTWMTSWTCAAVGVLAMTSSEVSVLILVFISLERFLLIALPFSSYQRVSMRTARGALTFIWALGFALALVPVVHWRRSRGFYGTNSMCFPLHIDDPYHKGWEYSAFVFLGVNLTSLALIALLYTGMFVSIYTTRHATSSGDVGELDLLYRFFFIVLTDVVCWAPIIGVKVMALARFKVPRHLYVWLVVFVLPVNSAVNPLLYTFTTPKYLGKIVHVNWVRARERLIGHRLSAGDTDSSRASSTRNVVAAYSVKITDQEEMRKISLPRF